MADNSKVLVGGSASIVRTPSSASEYQAITSQGPSTVFLGQAGVTTGTGLPFPPGSRIEIATNALPVSGITAGGPANLLVQAGIGAS